MESSSRAGYRGWAMLRRSYLGFAVRPTATIVALPSQLWVSGGALGKGDHDLWSVFYVLSQMTLAWMAEGYARLGSHLVKNSSHADSSPQNSIQAKGAHMGQSWAHMGKSPSWSSPLENHSRMYMGLQGCWLVMLHAVWQQKCGCFVDTQKSRDHKDRNPAH